MKLNMLFKQIGADVSGATAVEYGLILSLIFLAMLGAVSSFGNEAINLWSTVAEKVTAN